MDTHGSFDRKLGAVCRLLSTAVDSFPVGIQSLTIQFNVEVAPETDFHPAQSMPGWLQLDNILTGSSFANLRKVDLDLHFFFIVTASTAPAGWPPQIDIYAIHILSRLSIHPCIDFQLNIRNTCTPHPMTVYLNFL